MDFGVSFFGGEMALLSPIWGGGAPGQVGGATPPGVSKRSLPARGAEVPRPRDFAERTTAPAEPERPTTRRSTCAVPLPGSGSVGRHGVMTGCL